MAKQSKKDNRGRPNKRVQDLTAAAMTYLGEMRAKNMVPLLEELVDRQDMVMSELLMLRDEHVTLNEVLMKIENNQVYMLKRLSLQGDINVEAANYQLTQLLS